MDVGDAHGRIFELTDASGRDVRSSWLWPLRPKPRDEIGDVREFELIHERFPESGRS